MKSEALTPLGLLTATVWYLVVFKPEGDIAVAKQVTSYSPLTAEYGKMVYA